MAAASAASTVDGSWVEIFASSAVAGVDFDSDGKILGCGGKEDDRCGVRYYKSTVKASEGLYDADFLRGPSQTFELVHYGKHGFGRNEAAIFVGCGDEVHRLNPITMSPKGMVLKAQLKI